MKRKKKKNSRIVHGNNIYVYIKYSKFVLVRVICN